MSDLIISEKSSVRGNSGKKSRESQSSKISKISDDEPIIIEPERIYDFVGYNLGDNIIHVVGDTSFMFPQDGSLIKVHYSFTLFLFGRLQMRSFKRGRE